jgi:hypothetical protein
VAGITPAPGAKLEPDAIGAAQDTITDMASSGVLSHHPGSVPITQGWFSVTGIVVAGLIPLLVARFVLRSSFFQIARESEVNTHRRVGRR